jgi:hypothetical protein
MCARYVEDIQLAMQMYIQEEISYTYDEQELLALLNTMHTIISSNKYVTMIYVEKTERVAFYYFRL